MIGSEGVAPSPSPEGKAASRKITSAEGHVSYLRKNLLDSDACVGVLPLFGIIICR